MNAFIRGRCAPFLFAAALVSGGCSKDSNSGTDPGPDPGVVPDNVSLANSVVTVFPETIQVDETSVLTLIARSTSGADLTGGGLTVGFSASGGSTQGQISGTTDHGDGTYTATFTGVTEGSPTSIAATINGSAVTSSLPSLQVSAQPTLVDTTASIPLIDMAGFSYRGNPGFLYPESNEIPAAHVARQPAVDTSRPFVMLSAGFSNCKMEFCDPINTRDVSTGGSIGPQGCASWSMMGQAFGDATLNDNLVLVNGAQGGRDVTDWDEPTDPTYPIVTNILTQLGYSASDVQVVWAKQATIRPSSSLPNGDADAYNLLRNMGNVMRTLKIKYPNLKQVYLSSRMWSCGNGGPNDEPYAYETGFAVKWLIEAQMNQLSGGGVDALAGDLGLDVAPWLAWGPYFWANNGSGRSDGLTWFPSEMAPDCSHPGTTARRKIGTILLDFFKTSPLTTPWFLD